MRYSVSALVLLLPGFAIAEEPADAEADEQWQEEVLVTGTRIRNRDYASPSPVYTVSGDALELQGLPTLESYLNRLPQFSPSFDKTSANPGRGQATVNLRGLGENRNLVLIDGTRLGASGVDGVIDVNTLPTAMVERVEILTGGASSVYGSDAMSGVVNFITRRDFEGLEFTGNYDISERGDADTWSVNAAGGFVFADGSGNVSGFIDYYKRDPVLSPARDFSAVPLGDNWETGQLQFFGSSATPAGSIRWPTLLDGQFVNFVTFDADGNPRAFVFPDDLYNFNTFTHLQTGLERVSGRLGIDYDFANEMHARIEVLASHSEDDSQLAPPPAFDFFQVNLDNPVLTDATRQLFIDNYELLGDGFAYLNFRRRIEEPGPRIVSGARDNWRAGLSLEGRFGVGWNWQAAYYYAENKSDIALRNGALTSRLKQGLQVDPDTGACFDPGNGCVPVDMFGPGRISTEAAAFIRADDVTDKSAVTVHLVSAVVDGGFDIGLQERLAIAAGLEWRSENGSFDPDPLLFTGDVLGYLPSDAVDGEYDMGEVYLEAYLPLLRNARFARELSLETGVRYSNHSVIDEIWTWKNGLSWSPVDSLRLRAMYQHAVRAPNLVELYTVASDDLREAIGETGFTVNDPCQASADPVGNGYTDLCVAQGISADQVGVWEADPLYLRRFISGGNQGLDPEAADTWTVGLVWQPERLDGLSLALDWYQIDIEDAIQYMNGDLAIQTCFEVGNADSEFCRSFERADDWNISLQTGTYRNLSHIKAEGYDLQAEYRFDPPGSLPGQLGLGLLANWNRETTFQATDLSTAYRCDGLFGFPCDLTSFGTFPEFRTMTRLSWDTSAVRVELLWSWIDAVENALIQYPEDLFPFGFNPAIHSLAVEEIGSSSYLDLNASWQVSENFRLIAGVNNLTDNDPPLMGDQARQNNTDPSMYDVIGRRYHVSLNWRP
jgi:outer membrane receptor protein involved in Fe transport